MKTGQVAPVSIYKIGHMVQVSRHGNWKMASASRHGNRIHYTGFRTGHRNKPHCTGIVQVSTHSTCIKTYKLDILYTTGIRTRKQDAWHMYIQYLDMETGHMAQVSGHGQIQYKMQRQIQIPVPIQDTEKRHRCR
jgi:hypothetical protein